MKADGSNYTGTKKREDEMILSFESLEQKIGYQFNDPDLLTAAMTHSSYVNETGADRGACNERIEFLGDAVLELVSSDWLYSQFPDQPEGELTRMRVAVVCEQALFQKAQSISLSDYIRMGSGNTKRGDQSLPSVVSDALEALIGAIYLDGGINAAEQFIHCFILNGSADDLFVEDSKTMLQEMVQKAGTGDVRYKMIDSSGPDHDKVFTMAVVINGKTYESGTGRTKKAAGQQAAKRTIERLEKSREL